MLLSRILVIIFAVEMLIMFGLDFFNLLTPSYRIGFFDALLLALFSSPLLYWWTIRPVAQLLAERNKIRHQRDGLAQLIHAAHIAMHGRDPYTASHQRRVSTLAALIAIEMELEPFQIEGIRLAAEVHDLGKIHLPFELLTKPGKLTKQDRQLLETHCDAGYDILRHVVSPWPLAEVARCHHEHFDGTGYPRGLQGEEIPLEARIFAVADAVEAISADRPYRPSLGLARASEEIVTHSGSHYDPQVVAACLEVIHLPWQSYVADSTLPILSVAA